MKQIRNWFRDGAITWVIVIGFIGVMALGAAFATTDTYDTDTDASTMVGGVPYCVTFSGNSSTDTLRVNLPLGFVPKKVEFLPDADSSGANSKTEWYYGMDAGSAITFTSGSGATVFSPTGAADITNAGGVNYITFATTLQTNGGKYVGRACR
jgi:hypothetical protein